MEHKDKQIPFIVDHLFITLKGAYSIGGLLTANYYQSGMLTRPNLPTFMLGVNVLLWLVNMYLRIITSPILLCIWLMIVGGIGNCAFITYMFLACAETPLETDMKLIIYERELVVNLLLIAHDIGIFYGFGLTYWISSTYVHSIIYNPPN